MIQSQTFFSVNTRVIRRDGPITFVDTFGERLKAARNEAGLTQGQLAAAVGLKGQGAIGNMETGGRQGSTFTAAIAERLGVEPIWLETGKGPRYRKLVLQQDVSPYVAPIRRVPVISWVRAGELADIDALPDPQNGEWETIPFDGKLGPRGFVLVSDGDSMDDGTRSGIESGSYLFCDPDIQPSAGNLVIAKDVRTQKATFKKLTTDAGRWYLKPLNPQYQAIEIDNGDLRVIAVVTAVQPPVRNMR